MSPEDLLSSSIEELSEKLERIERVELILQHIMEINKLSMKKNSFYHQESYYLEQINKWMGLYGEQKKQIEEKEERIRALQKAHLSLLKRERKSK